jgi:multiple sugar transport system ATP-binding protein
VRSGHSESGLEHSSVPRVVFDSVTKVFVRSGGDRIRAVNDITFCVEDKERLVLVGPSGTGKTTLLRLVAGLETPSGGKISLGDKIINDVAPSQRDVAMVFQNPALYPHLSVYDNLGFGLRLRGCSRQELDLRVKEVAEMLGLTDCLAASPGEISGGQRQRVAVGRAIVRRVSLLLLDEPLANVDPTLRAQLRNDILAVTRKIGATLIYVTHDHFEAMLMGDRIAVLKEGRIQQLASPADLYDFPANLWVARFIGFPLMNIFHGVLLRKKANVYFEVSGSLSFKLDSALVPEWKPFLEKPIAVGLRPEQISAVNAESTADDVSLVRAAIDSVANVGPDTFLTASHGPISFVSRVGSKGRFALGQQYAFSFSMRHACLFDPLGGQALHKPCAS